MKALNVMVCLALTLFVGCGMSTDSGNKGVVPVSVLEGTTIVGHITIPETVGGEFANERYEGFTFYADGAMAVTADLTSNNASPQISVFALAVSPDPEEGENWIEPPLEGAGTFETSSNHLEVYLPQAGSYLVVASTYTSETLTQYELTLSTACFAQGGYCDRPNEGCTTPGYEATEHAGCGASSTCCVPIPGQSECELAGGQCVDSDCGPGWSTSRAICFQSGSRCCFPNSEAP